MLILRQFIEPFLPPHLTVYVSYRLFLFLYVDLFRLVYFRTVWFHRFRLIEKFISALLQMTKGIIYVLPCHFCLCSGEYTWHSTDLYYVSPRKWKSQKTDTSLCFHCHVQSLPWRFCRVNFLSIILQHLPRDLKPCPLKIQ